MKTLPTNIHELESGKLSLKMMVYIHKLGRKKSTHLHSFEPEQLDLATRIKARVKEMQEETSKPYLEDIKKEVKRIIKEAKN